MTEKCIAEQIYALEKEKKKSSERKIYEKNGDFLKKLNQFDRPENHGKHRSSIDGSMLMNVNQQPHA
jgi:hypothetical protein